MPDSNTPGDFEPEEEVISAADSRVARMILRSVERAVEQVPGETTTEKLYHMLDTRDPDKQIRRIAGLLAVLNATGDLVPLFEWIADHHIEAVNDDAKHAIVTVCSIQRLIATEVL